MLAPLLAVTFLGVVVVALGLWGRERYGIFGWSATPTQLGYCEQSYTLLDDQPMTWEQVVARDPQARNAVILEPTVGTLPVGVPLPSGDAPGDGYNGCGQLVLLHLAGGFHVLQAWRSVERAR